MMMLPTKIFPVYRFHSDWISFRQTDRVRYVHDHSCFIWFSIVLLSEKYLSEWTFVDTTLIRTVYTTLLFCVIRRFGSLCDGIFFNFYFFIKVGLSDILVRVIWSLTLSAYYRMKHISWELLLAIKRNKTQRKHERNTKKPFW